jgi:hypothetical protein
MVCAPCLPPSNNTAKARSNYFQQLIKLLPIGCTIGGDFNIVQDIDLDLIRPQAKSPYENGGWGELMELQGALQIQDGWRVQEGEEAKAFTKRTITHGIHTCQSRIDMVLTPRPTCPTQFPWVAHFGHDLVFWQGQNKSMGQSKADHVGVTPELTIQKNIEGETRKRAIKGTTFQNPKWAQNIDQYWDTHLAQKAGQFGTGLGALLDIFRDSPYNIICLQETHYNLRGYSQPYNYEKMCACRGYHAWFTHSGEATEGVAVIFKNQFSQEDIGVVEVIPNRCQLVQLVTGQGPIFCQFVCPFY